MSKYKISVFDGQKEHTFRANDGENLLELLQHNGILVQASCAGKGTCGKCQVKMNHLDTILACQYKISTDLEIHLPNLESYIILDELNPAARIMDNNSGLRIENKEGRRLVYFRGNQLIDEDWGNDKETTAYGIAVDIGTTTVVVYLIDIIHYMQIDSFSFLNPQSSYGADVISRVEYGMNNKNGVEQLGSILIHRINQAVDSLCSGNGVNPLNIYLGSMVGNTIMLHLLLGIDPSSISVAPYTPVFTEQKNLKGSDLKLKMHDKSVIKVLPSVSGYVGADILAGVASTDLTISDTYVLYLDIGTNGEIVLGKKDQVYCCATAAGPAFEGARIQCGVGGISGAISTYDEDGYITINGKPPIGICGSGLVDIVAYLLDQEIIDPTGRMNNDFIVETKKNAAVEHDIILSQKDIREVQLAKSAIYAGIAILIKEAGITSNQIGTVYLAGGFGNYIRIDSAVRIGLLPEELEDKVVSIGNAAGTGAIASLKSTLFEQEIERIKKKTQYIELSTHPDFMDAYVAAMSF